MLPQPIRNLIDYFCRLPGIGPKTAERFAFFILKQPTAVVEGFAKALLTAKQTSNKCTRCHNLCDQSLCSICQDSRRDTTVICVVAEQPDVEVIERTQSYRGLYHVLGGLINQLDGILPQDLEIESLAQRLNTETVTEIILALSATSEGESTSLYLEKNTLPQGLKITRLARGIPVGADIEYTDATTLTNALNNRTLVK